MHGYFWNRKHLAEILKEFVGGQFQMIRRTKQDTLHFRGEVEKINVAADQKKISFSFNWLCEERLVHDWSLQSRLKWFLLDHPVGNHSLEVPFRAYYVQPDEDRIKLWGGGWNEVCRFYKKGDHTNLTSNGDEIVPCWELHKLSFFHAMRVSLSLGKK
jgi:hypothetical protein